MIVDGHIYRITAKGTFQGQQNVNVFYYRAFDTEGAIELLEAIAAFVTVVIEVVKVIQRVSYVWDTVVMEDLTDGVTFATSAINVPGTYTDGASGQSFAAAGYRLLRQSKVTRNGYKRFGGLGVSIMSGNAWAGTASTILGNVATALQSTINIASGGDSTKLLPVIVGRTVDGEPDLTRWQQFVAQLQSVPTTQNTRKPGKGV